MSIIFAVDFKCKTLIRKKLFNWIFALVNKYEEISLIIHHMNNNKTHYPRKHTGSTFICLSILIKLYLLAVYRWLAINPMLVELTIEANGGSLVISSSNMAAMTSHANRHVFAHAWWQLFVAFSRDTCIRRDSVGASFERDPWMTADLLFPSSWRTPEYVPVFVEQYYNVSVMYTVRKVRTMNPLKYENDIKTKIS